MTTIAFMKGSVALAAVSVLSPAFAAPLHTDADQVEIPSLESLLQPAAVERAAAPSSASARQSEAAPDGPRSQFFITLGQRTMDDDVAWDMIDEPFALGLEYASRSGSSPFGFEGGLLLASDNTTLAGVDVDNAFVELYLGGRVTGDFGPEDRFHPYIGAGADFIFADITGSVGGFSVSDNDTSVGLYVHAGAYYRLGSSFSIGVDGRILTGTDVDLFGIATDADYQQISVMFGWGR